MSTDFAETPAPQALYARALGVITSPRNTYADIAARPRALGAILAVLAIIAAATFTFLSTEVGQQAALDQQISIMESFGRPPTNAELERMQQYASAGKYLALVSPLVLIPLMTAAAAGLTLAVFNGLLGGQATFKQAYAVVAHSWFLVVLQTLFTLPLNYVRESLASGTSLSVFFPMIDNASFAGLVVGSIDLFRIWWIVSVAIGLGVLYHRKAWPIARVMFVVYAVIILVFAGVRAALSGA